MKGSELAAVGVSHLRRPTQTAATTVHFVTVSGTHLQLVCLLCEKKRRRKNALLLPAVILAVSRSSDEGRRCTFCHRSLSNSTVRGHFDSQELAHHDSNYCFLSWFFVCLLRPAVNISASDVICCYFAATFDAWAE